MTLIISFKFSRYNFYDFFKNYSENSIDKKFEILNHNLVAYCSGTLRKFKIQILRSNTTAILLLVLEIKRFL